MNYLYGFVVIVGVNLTIQRLAFARVIQGPDATLREAFRHVLLTYRRAWLSTMLSHAITMLFLLLLVPGILIGLSYFVTTPLVLATRLGPIECLKWSSEHMRGHRGVAFATVCGVCIVPLFALGLALVALARLSPSGSGLPTSAASAVFGMCLLPSYIATVVMLLKLTSEPSELPIAPAA